jgi:hypothetical protein
MLLALMVNLVCLTGLVPPQPLLVSAVKRAEECALSTDAQCSLCPCWRVAPGCARAGCASGGCSYTTVLQWGDFGMSDRDGCVDMDLLPVPQEEWVYFVKEAQ